MSTIATPERMSGDSPTRWYDNYGRMPVHTFRAETVRGRFSNLSSKLLVAGCGAGYLVDELTQRGYTDVWGVDAAAWLITQGQLEMPQIATRLLVADCLSRPSLAAVRSAAGLSGNQRFAAVITDDLLPCMTSEAELQTLLTELRRVSSAMAHVVTCLHPWIQGDLESRIPNTGIWWQTAADWKASIGVTSEWLYDVELGEVIT